MDDISQTLDPVGASPGINSVLKPPRPRVPLKDLMLAAQDEDNTAARKRRVSFANVNKIKEFSAGAESALICHTPAYEEPFSSLSSDSSYPSGVDGWTPAKSNTAENHMEAQGTFYSEQRENMLARHISERPSLLPNQYSAYYSETDKLENDSRKCVTSRMSEMYMQNNDASPSCNSTLDEMEFTSMQARPVRNSTRFSVGMDLTNCINVHQATVRNSTRYSSGMDLTSVVEQFSGITHYSSEGMELTKTDVSHQPFTNQQLSSHKMSTTIDISLNDSDCLELTEAVDNPKLAAMSTVDSSNMKMTGNVISSVNNTTFSTSAMDMTNAVRSRHASVARKSTRYSMSNMDFTDAIGDVDSSNLDFTEVIGGQITSEIDQIGNKSNGGQTRFSTDMECTNVQDCLEYSADSETSMDFTKPIYNIYQSGNNRASMIPNSHSESTALVESQPLPSEETSCHDELTSKLQLLEDQEIDMNLTKSMPNIRSVKSRSSVMPNSQMELTTMVGNKSLDGRKLANCSTLINVNENCTSVDMSMNNTHMTKNPEIGMDLTKPTHNIQTVSNRASISNIEESFQFEEGQLLDERKSTNCSILVEASGDECMSSTTRSTNKTYFIKNSESCMDLTKPIQNMQTTNSRSNILPNSQMEFTIEVENQPLDNNELAHCSSLVDKYNEIPNRGTDKTYLLKNQETSMNFTKPTHKMTMDNRSTIVSNSGMDLTKVVENQALDENKSCNSIFKKENDNCEATHKSPEGLFKNNLRNNIATVTPKTANKHAEPLEISKGMSILETQNMTSNVPISKFNINQNYAINDGVLEKSTNFTTDIASKQLKNVDKEINCVIKEDLRIVGLQKELSITEKHNNDAFNDEKYIFYNQPAILPEKSNLCETPVSSCVKMFSEGMKTLNPGSSQVAEDYTLQAEVSEMDISIQSVSIENSPTKTKNQEEIKEYLIPNSGPQLNSEVPEIDQVKHMETEVDNMDISLTYDTTHGDNDQESVNITYKTKGTVAALNKTQISDFHLNKNDEQLSGNDCKQKEPTPEIQSDMNVSVDLVDVSQDLNDKTEINDDILYSVNITHTRGSVMKFRAPQTVMHNSFTNISKSETSLTCTHIDQKSVLESFPLIQCIDITKETRICPTDTSQVTRSVSLVLEKGGKRSFEEALEPENDTEGSPMKQICLSKSNPNITEFDLLGNVTAPSLLMDSFNIYNETTAANINQSEVGRPVNSLPLNEIQAEEMVEETRTDHDVSTVSLTGDSDHCSMELSKGLDKSGNNLCIQPVDVLTNNNLVLMPDDMKKNSVAIMDTSKITIHDSEHEEEMEATFNSTSNKETLSLNVMGTTSPHGFPLQTSVANFSNQSFTIPEKMSCGTNNRIIQSTSSLDTGCVSAFENQRKTFPVDPNCIAIFSKTKKVKHIGGGVFTCALIPKWIELEFSVESSLRIVKKDYQIVCPEMEREVGKYLQTQCKHSGVPELVPELILQLEESDQFLARLARNISLICKYHCGELKGNMLTIEVLNSRDHFWVFVDINIKYPQNLNANDVTISEQRIGKLELSQVRKVFNSFEKGPDQIYKFAVALTKLKY